MKETKTSDFRLKGYEFLSAGDNNKAIEYFLKAIDEGDALACIDMVLEIKYVNDNYIYSEESLEAISPEKFEYYLDLGIYLDSLDCMFYKAREQLIGDGFIDYNHKEAFRALKRLKERNYEPVYFDEDYSIDDYLEIARN